MFPRLDMFVPFFSYPVVAYRDKITDGSALDQFVVPDLPIMSLSLAIGASACSSARTTTRFIVMISQRANAASAAWRSFALSADARPRFISDHAGQRPSVESRSERAAFRRFVSIRTGTEREGALWVESSPRQSERRSSQGGGPRGPQGCGVRQFPHWSGLSIFEVVELRAQSTEMVDLPPEGRGAVTDAFQNYGEGEPVTLPALPALRMPSKKRSRAAWVGAVDGIRAARKCCDGKSRD